MKHLVFNFSEKWDKEERSLDEKTRRWNNKRQKKNNLTKLYYTNEQLSFEELKLPSEWNGLILDICLALDEAHPENIQNKNYKLYFSKLQQVVDKLNTAIRVTDDLKTIYSCNLAADQFKKIRDMYGYRSELFYTDNSEELDWLMIFLGEYVEGLIKAFSYRDCKQIRKGTGQFLFEYNYYAFRLKDVLCKYVGEIENLHKISNRNC